eukprot:scaffold160501_cov21-Tisochrysis_lutea.AAC.1
MDVIPIIQPLRYPCIVQPQAHVELQPQEGGPSKVQAPPLAVGGQQGLQRHAQVVAKHSAALVLRMSMGAMRKQGRVAVAE